MTAPQPDRGGATDASPASDDTLRHGPDLVEPPLPVHHPSADDGVERVLVVTAHPDDVDFGVAGSVATWVAAGMHVTYCICTDGDAGGSDRSMSRRDMARLRQREQRAAAAAVGVHEVIFLGHPDGRLVPNLELRRDISRVIRQVRPQRVVTQSPEHNWDRMAAAHPDHRAAGEATVCAVYPDARNPFAHPELLDDGLEPHVVQQLWLVGSSLANRFVDCTDVFDRKLAALASHASQVTDLDLDAILRTWMAANARAAGLPAGRLAEAFRVVDPG